MNWQPVENWRPISTAPRDGRQVKLLIPYDREIASEEECTDKGYWCRKDRCWRFTGDDGPDDIQPTHWMPLEPPSEGRE